MENYSLTNDKDELLKLTQAIVKLADGNKNALGFWRPATISDAINREKMIGAIRDSELYGFLIYSGVYPHAKVQAVVTAPEKRQVPLQTRN